MNDVTTQSDNDPFKRAMVATGGNAGAIAIESERAIAEAQGQLILAKKFPRSVSASMTEFLDTCASGDFAATAFYAVPNRGSGPSIRFAEEVARCYGNFQYGHRELSRGDGKSEVEVYAWDMQNNNYSKRQITVLHVMDSKNGPRRLTDQADIDNRIANVASKQMRGRILALMPKHMVAAGIEACKRTLAGGNEKPLRERIVAMAAAFGKFGVTNTMLEKHLGHAVDNTTIDELGDLMGIYNAIKDGGKASEYFPAETVTDAEGGAAKAVSDAVAAGKKAAATPTPKTQQAAAPAAAAAAPAAAAPQAATKPRAASKPAQEVSKPEQDEAPAHVDDGNVSDQSQQGDSAPPQGDDDDVF